MVTTKDIINFAFTHKVFTRKELIANLQNRKQISAPGSLSEQLDRLFKSGLLIRLERGVYSLPVNARKDFSVVCSEEMQRINQQLKNQFPFADYCIWSGSALIPYMHHIPNLSLLFVDVEREVAESVFNLLNSEQPEQFTR
jgi:predicted transcriptional regulator of viral defense system